MPHHLIIGGGPVATNAVETIRQFDSAAPITLVCDEPAHSRMALPYWLSGQFPREHTHTADDAYWKMLGVTARIGVRATGLDPKKNTVTLSDKTSLSFDTLLIATGASPVQLPIPGAELPGVQPLWTLAHTESLLQLAGGKSRPRVCMIGAGFIGFIMLNAMYKRGWQLAVVEREPHVLPRMLDADAAQIVECWLEDKGVALHCSATVGRISNPSASDPSLAIELSNSDTLDADAVIIATGITPNLDVVQGTGIKTAEGILVNDRMQTNFPHVYAGGDVAQGPVLYSTRPAIHAIQPTAVDHGRVAGANMAGQGVHYPGSLNMNVLDCCGLQCASFGNWADVSAEPMTISNPSASVYRHLLWRGKQVTGAVFVGRPNDLGMLTDVGMVKGILQTQTPLGEWKQYLKDNPFDIRRPYVATKVAHKLAHTTLLGRPAQPRQYRTGNAPPKTEVTAFHEVYVGTKN
jgi:NADPH-dependent 2,4-dienoyl-CoA reductase/sulfur reductase-like enzyme